MTATTAKDTVVWFTVYDTDIESDYYCFATEAEALALATKWAGMDWWRELADEAGYARITVYRAEDDSAPWDDGTADWVLWDHLDVVEVVAEVYDAD